MAALQDDTNVDSGPIPDDDTNPVLDSLQHALQDFALVFVASTTIFWALVLTGLSEWFVGWADAYPRLQLTALFLYAILLAVGFGMSILHRWMQLTKIAQQQRTTRQTLERKADELAHRNRELERFAYAASHDLREPLRMIHTYLGLLDREVDPAARDAEAREFLDAARNASRRMENLVRGILQCAQTSPDADTSEPTDPHETVDAAAENLTRRLDTRGVVLPA
jgi:signal transduction histidine kinase